jgi:glutathione S-transferase
VELPRWCRILTRTDLQAARSCLPSGALVSSPLIPDPFSAREKERGESADVGNGVAGSRAITWMFAALSTVEPPIVDREIVTYAERDKSWRDERMAMVEDRIRVRLGELSSRLGRADWLDGAFSAADILMVHVLRRLEGSGILEEYPNLSAYIARAETRPAYKRAFAAQLAVFTGKASTD